MPASTFPSVIGADKQGGENASVVSANETNQLKTNAGRVFRLIVTALGTAETVTIYDHASANTNPVYTETYSGTAPLIRDLNIPCGNGIRVVQSGTAAGTFTLTWS